MAESSPLYARVIGASWTEVAEPLRRLHAGRTTVRARGYLRTARGRNPFARVISSILRLPKPSAAADVDLRVAVCGGEEVWHRTFNGRGLRSRQYECRDAELAERYRGLEFRFRLELSGGGLVYLQRQAAFTLGPFRLRMPAKWSPHVEAREVPAGPGRINVSVRVGLPGIGPLITYEGTVALEDCDA